MPTTIIRIYRVNLDGYNQQWPTTMIQCHKRHRYKGCFTPTRMLVRWCAPPIFSDVQFFDAFWGLLYRYVWYILVNTVTPSGVSGGFGLESASPDVVNPMINLTAGHSLYHPFLANIGYGLQVYNWVDHITWVPLQSSIAFFQETTW